MKYKFLEKENWFKHDFRSREDKKLIRLKMKWKSAAPIGIFWQLCEMIYENAGMLDYDLDVIAFNCGDSIELVEDVINQCFIITDDNKLTHETITEQLDVREENYNAMVEKKSKAGKASAEAKRLAKLLEHNDNDSLTDVEQMLNTTQQTANTIQPETRVESIEKRVESPELRDKSKLLAVYKAPVEDVFISEDNKEVDYFQDDNAGIITWEMLDKVVDKFVKVDSKFKFYSVMNEINEDYGGLETLLEKYLPGDTSAQRKNVNLIQCGKKTGKLMRERLSIAISVYRVSDNSFVGIYSSYKECADALDINRHGIASCFSSKSRMKTHKGYKFEKI